MFKLLLIRRFYLVVVRTKHPDGFANSLIWVCTVCLTLSVEKTWLSCSKDVHKEAVGEKKTQLPCE